MKNELFGPFELLAVSLTTMRPLTVIYVSQDVHQIDVVLVAGQGSIDWDELL